ncbi:MAG: CDP-glycerol glycerophosphotransferase family protein, partial [Calditrichaceae bacterium]|nr:CDP-glycerol glycerophosphotransferase family protein [Calditrichaceae bacterium]
MPLYREIDGKFIVKKTKRSIQFRKYFRNGNASPDHKSLFNTPPIIKIATKDIPNLKGMLISLSNVAIRHNPGQLKTIFIGHGSGDKKYGAKFHSLESYDYHFLSGPKHLAKLEDVGLNIPEDKLIKIGNLRFDDYINDKIDKQQVLNRLGVRDQSRKNILYAPTWKWGDGTLLTYAKPFAEEITREHNLIIRPHHHDRVHIRKLKMWARLNNIKHVYFSNPAAVITSDTMFDFKVSDLLISDTSSILYEYLITGNPIIVIQNQYKDLHNMPDELNIMKHVALYDGNDSILKTVNSVLKNANSKDIYQTLLNNCFYFNDGKSVARAKEFITSVL